MLAAGFFNLPDTFVAAIALGVVLLLVLVIYFVGHKAGRLSAPWAPIVVLVLAIIACLGYSSVTDVPKGRVALLSDMHGNYTKVLSQGLQFKFPWESSETYDDVISASPLNIHEPIYEVPASRPISIRRDFIWSSQAEKKVNGSYQVASECIREFNNLIKAGQSVSTEFPCTFSDKSVLVLRE